MIIIMECLNKTISDDIEQVTYLSPAVKYFYYLADNRTSDNMIGDDYLTDEFILKTDVIIDNIGTDETDKQTIINLIPVLKSIHTKFIKLSKNKNINSDLLSLPDHYHYCYSQLLEDINNNNNDHSLECLLILTPLIERSLGNVLMSSGSVRTVPALLRDLLLEPVLEQVLGSSCVMVMRLLMGSPRTLNIRNIVWHGFVFPGEISNIFVTVLILIIPTIGDKLKNLTVKPRPFIHDWKVDSFQIIDFPTIEDLQCSASQSKLFFRENLPVLTTIQEHMIRENYGLVIILLLPLIESTLRRLFVEVNQCPERMLTAENDQFYTTFTEMLARHTEDETDNKLIDKLGESCVEMLYDWLILPPGPRLRDKVGHGELELLLRHDDHDGDDYDHTRDSHVMASHLIAIFSVLIQHVDDDSSYSESRLFKKYFGDYTSKFHQTTLLKNLLLENLKQIRLIDQHIVDGDDDDDEDCLAEELLKHKNKTLFRPKEEYEILNFMTKIANTVLKTVVNTIENVESKKQLLMKKELRSRQRVTYQRMMSTLPNLKKTLINLTKWSLRILQSLGDISTQIQIKKLKQILKNCENLSSNVSIDKNKWDEVEKLLTSLNINIHDSLSDLDLL